MTCSQNIIFIFICILHVLIWTFILLAFTRKDTARINLKIIVPIMYVLHMLPFHILMEAKQYLCGDDSVGTNVESVLWPFIIPIYFMKLQQIAERNCTFSPISPQGMLIFGAISSAYRLNI